MEGTGRWVLIALPVAAMLLLTLHVVWILHPQIADLRRKISDPKFTGTAHLAKLKFCFDRLHRRSVQLQRAILLLGGLGLAAAFFLL